MEFGSLNEHLIASVYPVSRDGVPLGTERVRAPVTDGSMEISLSWQSPFEAMGAEATAPILLAMVQSGEASDLLGALGGSFGSTVNTVLQQVGIGNVGDFLQQAQGRTGVTKMNSTQVFTGMPPLKLNLTLLFRAWANARQEVESPFDTLMSWALPKCLQADSMLTGAINAASGNASSATCAASNVASGISTFLPSITPTMVGVTYKGRTYSPLVIESIGFPIDSPVTAEGEYVELLVPISLGTLQALDASDWMALKTKTIPL